MAKKATKKSTAKKSTKDVKAVEVVETPVVEAVEEVIAEAAAEETVVEEVVAEAAAEEAVVEEVVAEAAVEEVVEEKKAPAKKAAKKAPAKKAAKRETVITLEFGDYKAVMSTIEEKVVAHFEAEGHKASEIKTLNIYLKPFDNSAYYVINENETGRVDMF